MGTVRAVLHREVAGRIKTVTVSRTATGKRFAPVLCDDGEPAPEPPQAVKAEAVTGVDLGLEDLVVTSTGEKVGNPRFLKRAEAGLRRKQKALSRKRKGSANRGKARALVAKAHERTANARKDFQDKLPGRLVDGSQAVCVETLSVRNMLGNRRLAKHVADAAWSGFVRKLEYKAGWSGRHFARTGRWFASTKTCSRCGVKADAMPLSVRQWTCGACGAGHDRDINAALNIRQQGILELKAAGLSVSSACGGLRKTGAPPAAA